MKPGTVVVAVLVVALAAAAALFWNDAAPLPGATAPAPATAILPEDTGATALLGDANAGAGVADRTAVRRHTGAAAAVAPPPAQGAVTLSGRLVGVDGAPRPRLELQFERPGPTTAATPVQTTPVQTTPVQTTTDGDGRFALRVPRDRAGELRVADGEHVFVRAARERLTVDPLRADRDLGDLEVARGATVRGVVRDRFGRSLADIAVTAGREQTGPLPVGVTAWQTRSDAGGGYALTGIPPGSFTVRTVSPAHLPAAETVALALGETTTVDLVLDAGLSIRGQVVDDRGLGVAAAQVGAYREQSLGTGVEVRSFSDGEAATTDDGGFFVLGGLASEPVSVRARKGGHDAAREAGVQPGRTDLVLQLVRHGAVRGVLVDDAGTPIAGSTVSTRRDDLVMIQTGSRTDDDGRFALGSVSPGRVQLHAEGDHVAATQTITLAPGGAVDGVRLVADRGAALLATVVDTAGVPVAGADVVVREVAAEAASGGFRSRRVERRSEDGGEEVTIDDGSPRVLGRARTGADGAARVAGLRSGAVEVRASRDGYAAALPGRATLPQRGETEIRLVLRDGGDLEVTVLDADGAALRGAAVIVTATAEGGDDPHRATSDADGKARLRALPEGAYTAALARPVQPIELGGATIVLDGGDADYETSRVPVRIRPRETARATLRQPVLTTLEGTLLDASGPVSGGRVRLARSDSAAGALPMGGPSATTDALGRFQIAGLTAGDYTIRFGSKEQLVLAEESLTLRGERVVERELVLRHGVVAVRVLDADGEPLRRAEVTLAPAGAEPGGEQPARPRVMVMMTVAQDENGQGEETSMTVGEGTASVRTDEEGVAVLDQVPAGKYVLRVEHSQHQDHRVDDVAVEAEQRVDLGDVRLAAAGAVHGRVEREDGGPAPMAATVELTALDGGQEPRTSTALRGAFRFRGLPAGRYTVRARPISPGPPGAWGPPQEVEVALGRSSRVTVQLPRP